MISSTLFPITWVDLVEVTIQPMPWIALTTSGMSSKIPFTAPLIPTPALRRLLLPTCYFTIEFQPWSSMNFIHQTLEDFWFEGSRSPALSFGHMHRSEKTTSENSSAQTTLSVTASATRDRLDSLQEEGQSEDSWSIKQSGSSTDESGQKKRAAKKKSSKDCSNSKQPMRRSKQLVERSHHGESEFCCAQINMCYVCVFYKNGLQPPPPPPT